MKKSVKITSTILAGIMMVSAMPVMSASAAKTSSVAKPKITVANVSKGVKVKWKKAKNAKKYVVYRKASGSKKYAKIKTIKKAKAGSFVDKKAKAGKTYRYKVTAVNGKYSASSSVKKIVRLETPKVWIKTEDGFISVGVSKKVKGAEKYDIYRAKITNGKTGKYKVIESIGTRTSDYYEDMSNNVLCKYKIKAVKGTSASAFSAVKKVDYITAPDCYVDLSPDYNGIDITWGILKGVEGFRIYRSDNGGSAKLIKDLKLKDCVKNTNNSIYTDYIYTDKKVTEGVSYTYSMEAYDGKRKSKRTKIFNAIQYNSAEYVVKVGETLTALAEEMAKVDEVFGGNVIYSYYSENEKIFTIDENFNIKGISVGRAYLIGTVTHQGDVSATFKVPVKVIK